MRGSRHDITRKATHRLLETSERLVMTTKRPQGLRMRGSRHGVIWKATHRLLETSERFVMTTKRPQGLRMRVPRHDITRKATHRLLETGKRVVMTAKRPQGLRMRVPRHGVIWKATHRLLETGKRLVMTTKRPQGLRKRGSRRRIGLANQVQLIEHPQCPIVVLGLAGKIRDDRHGLDQIFRPTAPRLSLHQFYQFVLGSTELPGPQPISNPTRRALDAG